MCSSDLRIQFNKLEKNRRCKCFNNPISDKKENVEFIEVLEGYVQMSGINSSNYKKTLEVINSNIKNKTQNYSINTITFSDIAQKNKNIHYLSIDIELPNTWKIPKKFATEDKVVELTSKTPNKRGFSFVCEFDDNNVNTNLENVKNIIAYNKEIESKERLLQQKISELKQIFETTKLDNLQSLKFELIEERLTNGEEVFNTDGERTGLAEE